MLKKCISFLILSSAATLYELLCFSSCLFKAPSPKYPVSSDWSVHTRLNQNCSLHLRSALSQISFQLALLLLWGVNYANVRYGNAVWCHKVTGQDLARTTDEAFQEQCFLWQWVALIDVDFDFFFFNMHKNRYNTCKKRKKNKKKHWKVFFKTENMLFKSCWHIALPAGWHLSGCGCTSLGISIIWPLPSLLLSQYAVIIIT